MYRICLIIVLVNGALSQSVVPGKCEKPENAVALYENDILALLGTFYQIARVPNSNEQGDCSTTTLAVRDPTAGIISNREVLNNGTVRTWSGFIFKTDDFTFLFDYGELKYTNYVLATDHSSYLMIYSCEDVPNSNTKYVWSWILSKTSQLSDEALKAVVTALVDNRDLWQVMWHYTNQTDC